MVFERHTLFILKNEKKKFTKKNLPTKICAACEKPMAWRKRWEKVWTEVKFCSEKCRRNKEKTAAD